MTFDLVTPYTVFTTETYEKYISVPGTFYTGLQHSLLSAITMQQAYGTQALLPVGPYSLPCSTPCQDAPTYRKHVAHTMHILHT